MVLLAMLLEHTMQIAVLLAMLLAPHDA